MSDKIRGALRKELLYERSRTGGNVQWNLNRGMWSARSGNEKPHKCLRTFSHKTGYTNILENLEAQSHSSPGGQHGSFDISVKDGGYPEFKISPINKRNMGSSSPVWDHSYCRVPSQQTERDSRLGVKKQFGLLGMETISVISENLSTGENSRDRSICFQIISSDQDLLFVEARSIEPSSRCLPTTLIPQESLCSSPILHDPKSFEQSLERESTYDDPCNSSLGITTVVPRSNENVHTTTNFIDLEERSL